MHTMSKERNISFGPKLRFPSFAKKATWKERNLSEVLFEHDERSTGKEEVFSVSVHKGVVNQIEHLGRSFSAANTDNYKRVLPGDIIYTKSPTGDFPYGIIKQSKVSKPVIVSPLYGVFKPETNALGVILDAYFEYPGNVYNYLYSIIQKGAKNTINITNDTFLSKTLILPTDKDEQQKIADCLSSLDELITAENQKLEALQLHKKGLMQQLFPAEGEKVPKLRFNEFRKQSWNKVALPDTAWYQEGPGLRNWQFKNEGIKVINISNLVDGYLDLSRTDRHISLEEFDKIYKHFAIDAGDIVLASSGNSYCKHAVVRQQDLPLLMNTSVIRFKPRENCEYEYLNQFLKSPILKKQIDNLITGGAQPNFGPAHLAKVIIPLPEKSEQQKIADCLSSLDNLIAEQTQKIESLKAHKKGLMQQLFPDVNASE